MKKWSLHCCYGQFLVFSLKNSSPPLIRIQNCHQKQDLGCKNPNFVKRVIWRIFDLLFWKNTCFSLFFFNFGVNLLKYAPTHTNDCSSLKKINKKRKQNIPKLSSAQSTVPPHRVGQGKGPTPRKKEGFPPPAPWKLPKPVGRSGAKLISIHWNSEGNKEESKLYAMDHSANSSIHIKLKNIQSPANPTSSRLLSL